MPVMSFKNFLVRIAVLMMVFSIASQASSAQGEIGDKQNAVAKIFYVTTRKWDGKSFTSERGESNKHSFGTCRVHFPLSSTRWDIRKYFSSLAALGWEAESGNKNWSITKVWRNEDYDRFLEGLRPSVNASGELFIYVHGYHNSFNDAAIDASKLASFLKMPIIAYSWPTPKTVIPTLRNYNTAQNDVQWSQQPFSDFVKKLLSEFPNQTLSIVCHSMGSRLVIGAIHDLFPGGGSPVIREIAFASADYDSDTFVQRAGSGIGAAKVVRIYVSPEDRAMGVSKWFVKGQTRVGDPGDNQDKLIALPNTEVIDFTAFGAGATGHDMAHSLISNMHKYSRPGSPWRLQRQSIKLVRVRN